MAWLDGLPEDLRSKWVQIVSRVNALLDDLEAVRTGRLALSVPESETNRVLAWGETEKRNIDNFVDEVLSAQEAVSALGIFGGYGMRLDASALKRKITAAQNAAEFAIAGEQTLQTIDPELQEIGATPPPVAAATKLILLALVIGVAFFGATAIVRG
jgi:hypothetical protein